MFFCYQKHVKHLIQNVMHFSFLRAVVTSCSGTFIFCTFFYVLLKFKKRVLTFFYLQVNVLTSVGLSAT